MLKDFFLVMVVIMKQHQIYYHYQHQFNWCRFNGAFKANINIKEWNQLWYIPKMV
jgi:hypothetical protein